MIIIYRPRMFGVCGRVVSCFHLKGGHLRRLGSRRHRRGIVYRCHCWMIECEGTQVDMRKYREGEKRGNVG